MKSKSPKVNLYYCNTFLWLFQYICQPDSPLSRRWLNNSMGEMTAVGWSDFCYFWKNECYVEKVELYNNIVNYLFTRRESLRSRRSQSIYLVKEFRLYDRMLLEDRENFIFGWKSRGYFDLRTLGGDHIHKSATYKKLTLLETRRLFLAERRRAGLVNVSG